MGAGKIRRRRRACHQGRGEGGQPGVNLTELLTIPASMYPDRETLWFEGRGYTYRERQEGVGRSAAALRDLRISPGDRVAFLQTSDPATVTLLFAAPSVGGVVVPLNYRSRADELQHMLAVAAPRLLIVGERYHEMALAAAPTSTRVLDVNAWEEIVAAHSPDQDAVETDDDKLAMLMFTSGTTAYPKAVMLTHGDLVNYVLATTEPASDESSGTSLLAAPLYHIAGVSATLTATFAGRRLAVMPQFDPAEWLRLAQQLQVTHAFLVPTMLKRVLEHPDFERTSLSHLRVLSYGAAPMPLSLIRMAIDRLPQTVDFINAFGQTETTATVTMLGPEDHRLSGSPEEVARKLQRLGSIGRALSDVEIAIAGPEGQNMGIGQIGEIVLRTQRVMQGYWGQPEATEDTLRDGWLHTRDLGWMDEDGYVFLAGRQSDMIIRGGENIAPQEVELVLASHPAVDDVAVFGIPDEDWGEIVGAAIVLRLDNHATVDDLRAHCKAHLASYKEPASIHIVEALPRNEVGKVLRRELRRQYAPASVGSGVIG